MNRKAKTAAALTLALALAGCTPSLVDRSYDAVRDGAQKALSLTFSVAAAVTNWLPATPEAPPPSPCCPRARPS
ncbi:MAG TPA: hypothetical protein VFC23_09545 [Thermoanaerobaculia bacterium]|nr:hypothetical protein [Thermoanaerobaculia bacterium]